MRFSFVFVFAAVIAGACSGKKNQAKEEQTQAMLTRFFEVPQGPGIGGVWVANQDSVAQLIEKKYLASYQAKPDEMQASQIRERLKSLSIYYRIDTRSIAMLTTVADSIGVSGGAIQATRPDKPGVQTFSATIRGKNGSLVAIVRYFKGNEEKIEYQEDGLVITAYREKRAASEVIKLLTDQMKSGTGLTQY